MNTAEHEWSDKVLKITMKIRDQYPELSKYFIEMPETIPDEKNPEVSLNSLKAYYESLNSTLNKYMLENEVKEGTI